MNYYNNILLLLSILLLIISILNLIKSINLNGSNLNVSTLKDSTLKDSNLNFTLKFNVNKPCNLGCALALTNPKSLYSKNGQARCTNAMIQGVEDMSLDCYYGAIGCIFNSCCSSNCTSCIPPKSSPNLPNPDDALNPLLNLTYFLEEYPFMIFP